MQNNMTGANGCFAALGCFDGLHIGHREVITCPDGENRKRTVLSIASNPEARRLMQRDRWLSTLRDWGAQEVIEPPFSEIKDMTPREFVEDFLGTKLHAGHVSCGYNFRFGKNANGDAELLSRLCEESGMKCTVVPEVDFGSCSVSSTEIRRCLTLGETERANAMLGRRFGWSLTVVHGNALGHTLGTPTINQVFPDDLFLPKFGVYASETVIDGVKRYGVTNVGVKPTVGSPCPLGETWIPEFSGDLYGREVEVGLISFIRPEEKFENLDLLREAIHRDAEKSKEVFRRTFGE